MRKSPICKLGAAVLVAAGCVDWVAAAAAEEPARLDEIIVTARFRSESAMDIGASITALDSKKLQQEGIDSVADLAASTPSLDIQDRGPNRNEISIRGVGRGLFQQDLSLSAANIGLYFDDVPLNLPLGAQLDVPSFDLNRVEVLRGPQGTLFGEGAQGGAIRYVSQDPNLSKLEGSAEVYANSTQSGGTGFGGRAAVSVPLMEDKLAARLVVNRTALGGFIDDVADGRSDTNDFKSTNVRGSLLWRPTDAFRARVVGVYQDSHQDTLGYVSDPQAAKFAVFSTADNLVDDRYKLFSANLRYDFGPLAVESISSYFDRERRRRIFEPVFTGQLGLLGAALGAPAVVDVDNIDGTNYDQFSQEFRLVSNLEGRFNFVAGAFYRRFDLKLDTDTESQKYVELSPTYAFLLGVPPVASPSPRASVLAEQLGLTTLFNAPGVGTVKNEGKQLSGFFEATFKLSEQFRLIAGVRKHHEKIEATSIASAADFLSSFAPPANFKDSTTADAWLPKGVLEFRPTADVLLYGSYSKGVRNGNLNASSSVAAIAANNPDRAEEIQVFGPEFVTAYEVGVKGATSDRRMTFAIAAFYNKIKDVQGFGTAVLQNQVAGVTENIGDGHSKGFDAELTIRPSDRVNLFLGGNYVNSEIDSIKTGLVSVITTVEGQRLPFIPKYSFSLGGNAQIPISASGLELFGTASLQYTGKYTTFFQSAEGSAQNPILGGYGLVNVGIGLRKDRWQADLRVANLFNRREVISASPIQDLFLSFGLQLPPGANIDDLQMTRPRTSTLMLRYSF